MFRFIYLLIVFIFLWTCQENPSEPTTSNNDVALNENVTILKEGEDSSIQYVSPDRDTIKFIYSVPLLHRLYKEQILVSKWQNGFVVKVLDIKIESDQIVLITRPASLTEIFEKCKLDTTIHVSPQQVQKIETLRKGLKVEQPYDDLFQVDINDVTLYDLDGNEYTTYDQLKADGHYSFGIDLDFKFTIDNFQLTHLLFKSTITQTGQLDLYQNVGMLDYKNKVDLVKYYLSPITIMVGPVPVVIQPVVRFVVGAGGKFDVQVTSTLIRQESFTSGLELKNGSWQQISETDNSFDFEPPSLSASGLLKGYAGPQVDLMLYGLLGPYMLVDPYLELDADIQQTPWWVLYGGLEVGVGVHLGLFEQTLADVFYPKVIDLKDTVATATEEPPEDNNQPQLIAYYPFNGNANDESGNGHNGQVDGATLTTDRFGNANSAYYFNGSNNRIIVPDQKDLRLENTSFTLLAWTNLEEYGHSKDRPILYKGETDWDQGCYNCIKNGYNFWFGWNNDIRLDMGHARFMEFTENDPINKWEMFTIIFDKDKDKVKIYENTKLLKEFSQNNPLTNITNNPLYIGYCENYWGSWFKGKIDDIRIYNYALSESEISALYHEIGW